MSDESPVKKFEPKNEGPFRRGRPLRLFGEKKMKAFAADEEGARGHSRGRLLSRNDLSYFFSAFPLPRSMGFMRSPSFTSALEMGNAAKTMTRI